MEVAVSVTVWDGDDEEVFVGTALRGGQPLQGPVQLTLARTLGLGTKEQKNQQMRKAGRSSWGSELKGERS